MEKKSRPVSRQEEHSVDKYDLPHMAPQVLEQLIGKLEGMRRESKQIIQQHLHQDLGAQGEGSEVGDDMDHASNERERELGLLLRQRHLRRIQQVDEAFERMDDGTYGLCEGLEEPINPERLLIMPLARYSLEYQQQQERTQGRGHRFSDDDDLAVDDSN